MKPYINHVMKTIEGAAYGSPQNGYKLGKQLWMMEV